LALAELHHQLTRNADSAMIAGIALQAVDTRRVLMLQRSDTKEWEFPGGHVQTGETIEQGAIREWQEETGLNFRGKLLPMWRWTTPTYNGHYVGMLAECPSELTFGALPAETSALKWVKPSELKDLDLRPSVRASLPTFLPMLRMDASERGTFEDALIREEARALLQSLTVTVNKTYAFVTDPEKVRQFQAWLRTQISVAGLSDEQLWRRYAAAGFRKGAARSYDDVSAKQLRAESEDFYKGGRAQFLESSFNRPETVDKVKLLAGRSYSDMKGVTDVMATRMSRKLVDGLVEGKNPREIGGDIDDELDLAEGRATTIARTEIVRAHAEGQLDSMEQLGVDEIGVEVEFATADDGDVCDECDDLEGDTYSVDDAHGVIPVHPNCRCAFIPTGDALKL